LNFRDLTLVKNHILCSIFTTPGLVPEARYQLLRFSYSVGESMLVKDSTAYQFIIFIIYHHAKDCHELG